MQSSSPEFFFLLSYSPYASSFWWRLAPLSNLAYELARIVMCIRVILMKPAYYKDKDCSLVQQLEKEMHILLLKGPSWFYLNFGNWRANPRSLFWKAKTSQALQLNLMLIKLRELGHDFKIYTFCKHSTHIYHVKTSYICPPLLWLSANF